MVGAQHAAEADARLRIPNQDLRPCRQEPVTCRKFAPSARNYMVARLSAAVGLRIDEACMLELETSSGAGSAS